MEQTAPKEPMEQTDVPMEQTAPKEPMEQTDPPKKPCRALPDGPERREERRWRSVTAAMRRSVVPSACPSPNVLASRALYALCPWTVAGYPGRTRAYAEYCRGYLGASSLEMLRHGRRLLQAGLARHLAQLLRSRAEAYLALVVELEEHAGMMDARGDRRFGRQPGKVGVGCMEVRDRGEGAATSGRGCQTPGEVQATRSAREKRERKR